MKSFYSYVALFTLLGVGTVNAGVFPTFPDGNSILTPNQQTTITWKDDGKKPSLNELGKINVELMTGGDMNQVPLDLIGTPDAPVGKLAWAVPEVDPAGKFYFLRFSNDKNITAFTTRFTITDKTGKAPPADTTPAPAVGKNPGKVGKIVAKGVSNPNGAMVDPKQAPATSNQTPAEVPKQTPVEAPKQTPAETPKQTPAEAPKAKAKVAARGEPAAKGDTKAPAPKGDAKAPANAAPSAAPSGKTSSALSINNNGKTLGLTFIGLLYLAL